MSDLIKREDAIKAIHNYWKKRLDTLPTADIQQTDKILEHNKTLCNFINAIPSADRPQGEWFKDENGDYRCSECGGCEEQFIYGTENWYGLGESKFCPSCGARMKGADYE